MQRDGSHLVRHELAKENLKHEVDAAAKAKALSEWATKTKKARSFEDQLRSLDAKIDLYGY